MRIIGGEKQGRKLVPWEEVDIRPMRDFVRTALFNILADFVQEARFLDLFAGTGSVGLEALSRGAAEAVFVDLSPEACGIVRRNLDSLGLTRRAEVLQTGFAEGLDYLAGQGKVFDLVFVGPPYGKGLAEEALGLLGRGGSRSPGRSGGGRGVQERGASSLLFSAPLGRQAPVRRQRPPILSSGGA